MSTATLPALRACRPAWRKGRIVGQKRPPQPTQVWAIRVRLEIAHRARELALFNLAVDSKLRGCDLVRLKVADAYAAGPVKHRAAIVQSKTSKPVRFEITEGTRKAIETWLAPPAHGWVGASLVGTVPRTSTHFGEAVCSPCPGLGGLHRSRAARLRHPFHVSHQGRADLSEDRHSWSSAAFVWSHENGKHCALPRRRTGGCGRDRGVGRNLADKGRSAVAGPEPAFRHNVENNGPRVQL